MKNISILFENKSQSIRIIFYQLESSFSKTLLKIMTEAANRGVLWKKVFLEISQNSQENLSPKVSFLIKLQASGLRLY